MWAAGASVLNLIPAIIATAIGEASVTARRDSRDVIVSSAAAQPSFVVMTDRYAKSGGAATKAVLLGAAP